MSRTDQQASGGSATTTPAGRAAALNHFLSRAQLALLSARFTGTASSLVEEHRPTL